MTKQEVGSEISMDTTMVSKIVSCWLCVVVTKGEGSGSSSQMGEARGEVCECTFIQTQSSI